MNRMVPLLNYIYGHSDPLIIHVHRTRVSYSLTRSIKLFEKDVTSSLFKEENIVYFFRYLFSILIILKFKINFKSNYSNKELLFLNTFSVLFCSTFLIMITRKIRSFA